MKKLISLTLASFCLLSVVSTALAAGQTYDLPDLNMMIDAPEGWSVFSRYYVKEDDPNLELIGMDSKELINVYKKNNIYLDMISTGAVAEIIVAMIEDENSQDTYDFNLISDSDMLSEAESFMKETKDEATYSDCSIYKHNQAKFMVFNFTQQINGITAYGKQYVTVINGNDIQIVLFSYGSEISDSLAQTVQDTVDSITFLHVRQKPTRISAFFTIAMNIAAVFGIVWLIAFLINRRKKPKLYRPLPGRYL